MPKLKVVSVATLSISFALFSALLFCAIATHAYYRNKVLPFTYLAGENISGERFEDLNTVVKNIIVDQTNRQIPVSFNNKSTTLNVEKLGISFNLTQTTSALVREYTPWEWAKLDYWITFFNKRTIYPSYSTDIKKFNSTIASITGEAKEAKDAKITVVNGTLTVVPSANGAEVKLSEVKHDLNKFFAGDISTIVFVSRVIVPEITTEMATKAKNEISTSIKAVKLKTTTNKEYSLEKVDIYTALTYSPKDSVLSWALQPETLEEIIDEKIGSKVAVPMVQKTVDKLTNRVIIQGRNGTEIPTSEVAMRVINAVNQKIDTEINPISVPVQTVQFTTRHLEGPYKLNLINGLYVYVNISRQRMYIINKDTLLKEFIISSGKVGRSTPKGIYYVKNKISLAQGPLYPNIWLRYWNALSRNPDGSGYNGYGVHDLPCLDSQCKVMAGASMLGRPASHGCLRLGNENALWFFQNVPIKTPVYIF